MAGPALQKSVVAVATILLAGCLGGVGPSRAGDSSNLGPKTSDGDAALNLTIEVVNWSARWIPGIVEESITPGAVKVMVWVNGSLTRAGDPVADAKIEGNATARITAPWTRYETTNVPYMVTRGDDFTAHTGVDGNVSLAVGPLMFDASPAPPVLFPHCETTDTEATGTVQMADATDPNDTHRIRPRMCTQSYP